MVTDRHAKVDWALLIKELVEEHYPEKGKIIMVMDSVNTPPSLAGGVFTCNGADEHLCPLA